MGRICRTGLKTTGLAALGLLVSLLAGCGNSLVPRTTLAEARMICDSWEVASDTEWNFVLIVMETLRDSGLEKADALGRTFDFCVEQDSTECFFCQSALIDAVWP